MAEGVNLEPAEAAARLEWPTAELSDYQIRDGSGSSQPVGQSLGDPFLDADAEFLAQTRARVAHFERLVDTRIRDLHNAAERVAAELDALADQRLEDCERIASKHTQELESAVGRLHTELDKVGTYRTAELKHTTESNLAELDRLATHYREGLERDLQRAQGDFERSASRRFTELEHRAEERISAREQSAARALEAQERGNTDRLDELVVRNDRIRFLLVWVFVVALLAAGLAGVSLALGR